MTTPAAAAAAGRLFRATPQTGGSPPEATLVSSYKLDGGSAADDVGSVNGAVIGTWTATDTDSMVVGDAGTSLYKSSGTAHVTLPASQAAHDLSELSISFYYQAAGTGIQQILFNCGDGTVIGDFSCERQNNGKLRLWHVGQDGGLRHAGPGGVGDSDGIAGTNLVVGTAYRITLTFGPAGLKVYLNDTEVATITENTNGWNNARVKYLGVWNDGSAVPAVGAFDHLRIWSGQLTASGVAALAAAQSITPPATEGLVVPRTDVWLTNDDMAIPGTGTVRYAIPGGSGTGGTTEGAAGNLQTTLTASAAGDTVVCLQGYYDAPNGLTFPAGSSAGNPVTVMAKPGEWAVICQDIDLMKLPNIPAGAGRPAEVQWTLHDAAHNVWRIPYTASTGAVVGCWFEGGIAHLLLPYDEPAHMLASEGGDKAGDTRDSVNKTNTRFVYWGPGVGVGNSTGGDGTTHLFIRFDRPNWTDCGFVDSTLGAWPDDERWTVGVEGQATPRKWFSRSNSGDFKTGRPCMPNPLNETPNSNGDFPSGQAVARNPNSARIYVARTFDRSVINASSGGFIRIGSGMNTHGFKRFSSAKSNIEVHRGCDWLPFSGVEGSCSNITFHRRRQFQGVWRWLASMAAYKFNDFLSPPNQAWEFSANTHSVFLNGNTGSLNNITWDNCSLYGYHELILGTNACERIRFVNCCIGWLYDEFMQVFPHQFSRFEVGYCYFRDSSFGMGTDISNGNQSPHGSVFWHHNIIDARCGRASFGGSRPVNGGPVCVGRAHSGTTAQKMYNNTWIQSPDGPSAHGLAMGNQLNHRLVTGGTSRVEYDEVFNNIIVRHDNKRYATNEGGQTNRDDSVEHGVMTLSGHNAYRDYNCYSRHGLPMVGAAFDRAKYYELNDHYDQSVGNFAYIRAQPAGEPAGSVFFGSSQYNNTKTMQSLAHPQAAGFDDNGTDENPQIPSQTGFPANRMDFRPTALSVVSATATPPSETNWWTSPGWTSYGAQTVPFNLAPSAWKGALDPNGTTAPVGVQNP